MFYRSQRLFAGAALCGALLLGAAVAAAQPGAPAPSAPGPQTEPAAAPPQPPAVGDHNNTLADQLPPEQVLWLDIELPAPASANSPDAGPAAAAAGDAQKPPPEMPPSADGRKFLARHIGDLSGEARGAVVILHDSRQHPSWPLTVAALLDDLPLHGWNTLSIELPAPMQDVPAAPTPAPPADASAEKTPSEKTVDDKAAAPPPTSRTAPEAPGLTPEALAQARIKAALHYLTADRETPVVIIGFGSGAYRAAEFARRLAAANRSAAPIAALVLVAPRNRLPGVAPDLPKLLPETDLPTLDIVLGSDPQARADAEARRRAVLRQRGRVYQRIELPPVNGAASADHSLMVKRVRGFLQQRTASAGEGATAARAPQGAAPAVPQR